MVPPKAPPDQRGNLVIPRAKPLMAGPPGRPAAKPLMAKPKPVTKARSSAPRPGSVLRRDMWADYGSTQHIANPHLSDRRELRQWRLSDADWARLG
eukprot:9394481-Heterocapsa_arctica.AAC.1